MAEYRLLIKGPAKKEIESVSPKTVRQRIIERIQGALAEDPRAHGSEKLAGSAYRYRVRQGNYRIIYLLDDERRDVTIFKVGNRKNVYR